MGNSLEQNEVLSLQEQIIPWLKPKPTTIEAGQMMELLGKALDYYKTLIELEERLNGTSAERVRRKGQTLTIDGWSLLPAPSLLAVFGRLSQ